jgi:hypothetical protein
MPSDRIAVIARRPWASPPGPVATDRPRYALLTRNPIRRGSKDPHLAKAVSALPHKRNPVDAMQALAAGPPRRLATASCR